MIDSDGWMFLSDGGEAGGAGDVAPEPARDAALRAMIPAHALGATDRADASAVEALVARDPAAAAELAYFKPLRNALLYGAEPVLPPPALEARLRAATLPAAGRAPTQQRQPATPQAAPPVLPPTAQPTFQSTAQSAAQPRWKRWFAPASRPAWALAAAALTMLVLTNLWWGAQAQQLRTAQAQALAAQAAAQAEQAAAATARATADARVAEYNHMLAAAATGKAETAMLPAADAALTADTHAMVIWMPGDTSAMVMAEEFPPLKPGAVYQVWLLHGEDRMSAGLFSVDASGSAMMMVESPMPLDTLDGVGITMEPAGGSPTPTGELVVRGMMAEVSG